MGQSEYLYTRKSPNKQTLMCMQLWTARQIRNWQREPKAGIDQLAVVLVDMENWFDLKGLGNSFLRNVAETMVSETMKAPEKLETFSFFCFCWVSTTRTSPPVSNFVNWQRALLLMWLTPNTNIGTCSVHLRVYDMLIFQSSIPPYLYKEANLTEELSKLSLGAMNRAPWHWQNTDMWDVYRRRKLKIYCKGAI